MRRFMGLRWLTIGLIMLGALVNFLSRQTLSIAAPIVIANLHITTQQYGWITSAFQGGIMLQPVVGYVIDILGVKSGFALFAFLWSVICMAHGLASNWQILAGLRGLLGFAEGAFSPGGLKQPPQPLVLKSRKKTNRPAGRKRLALRRMFMRWERSCTNCSRGVRR